MTSRRIISIFLALVLAAFFGLGTVYAAPAKGSGKAVAAQTVKQAEPAKKGIFESIASPFIAAVDSVAAVVASVRDYIFGKPAQQEAGKTIAKDNEEPASTNEFALEGEVVQDASDVLSSADAPAVLSDTQKEVVVRSVGVPVKEVQLPSGVQQVSQGQTVAQTSAVGSAKVATMAPVAPATSNAKNTSAGSAAQNFKSTVAKNDTFSLSKVVDSESSSVSAGAEVVTSGEERISISATQGSSQASPVAAASTRSQVAAPQSLAPVAVSQGAAAASLGESQVSAPVASSIISTSPVYVTRSSTTQLQSTVPSSTTVATASQPTSRISEPVTVATTRQETTRASAEEESAVEDETGDRVAAQTIEIEPVERVTIPQVEVPEVPPAAVEEVACVGSFDKAVRGAVNNLKISENKYAVVLSIDGESEIRTSVDLCTGSVVVCRTGSTGAGCNVEIVRATASRAAAEAVTFAMALSEKMLFVYDGRVWLTGDAHKLVGKIFTENLVSDRRVLLSSEFYRLDRIAARAGDSVKVEECVSCRVEFSLKDTNSVELTSLLSGTGFDRVLNPPIRFSGVQLANGIARGVYTLDAIATATDPADGIAVRLAREFFVIYQ